MKLARGAVLVFGCSALALACASDEPPPPQPPACTIKNSEDCPDPAPTYAADIKPILDARCNGCHSDDSDGPWPLTSYQDVVDWWDRVRGDTLNCSMPPPDSGIVMTHEESKLLLDWIACDMPE